MKFNINQTKNNATNETTADTKAPVISIVSPTVKRGFKQTTKEKQIEVEGKATDESGIFEVLVNGSEATVQPDGSFKATVLLAVGDNTITVKATDVKQNVANEIFTITRKSEEQTVANNTTKTKNKINPAGKYYALIIGIAEYKDESITSLDEPVKDAQKFYNILTSQYTFESQNVTFLKNSTRAEIIDAMDGLSNKITENDNLLIFYAGHGYWDEAKGLGYWLPSDSKKKSTANWFANSSLRDYIGSIKSKHTLLIADACFSGGIFKTRSAFSDAPTAIEQLYALPSRKAMTSGMLKEVPDKSVFMKYLLERLSSNKEKYISSEQLFSSFRTAVMNNSENVPQYGEIKSAGDEGGDFIFIKK